MKVFLVRSIFALVGAAAGGFLGFCVGCVPFMILSFGWMVANIDLEWWKSVVPTFWTVSTLGGALIGAWVFSLLGRRRRRAAELRGDAGNDA